ncbi:hypothetical protein FsymDg_4361 [Candidatus Protofrankia datiscae]|uniref:Uncharacterized protein n=1 Tax=Candidatus Protofrankia datiscae TaxID=2716812 RepID=F8AYN9_9ACTN|nr:hypothetical protein [Candidatus Protofrankia datiscae]AEH07702.1 hypothetical protein FsymDg_0121 [Candidatus Protofrankia datiscae]AEH11614.1 hypothetical protein FsymDg_4361 [Candidatus Protofrankia datiscae]
MRLFGSGTNRRRVAGHEARHVVIARHFGATNLTARITPDGSHGYFTGDFDGTKEQEAVILLAGGSRTDMPGMRGVLPHGGDSDLKQAKRLLRGSGMSVRQAEREAQKLVRKNRGAIKRETRKIEKRNR